MNAVFDAGSQNDNFVDYTDEELFVEYRDFNSRRCLDELFCRYQARLTSYLRRRVGSREIAEDAFQAAFLRAMTKSESFDAERSFRPWLYRVALNQAIDLTRRSKRFDEMIRLDAVENDDSSPWADSIPGRELDPRGAAEAKEAAQTVRSAIAQLPECCRQILEMIFFQGLERREAAESLLLTSSAVGDRLQTALRQFRRSKALKPLLVVGQY